MEKSGNVRFMTKRNLPVLSDEDYILYERNPMFNKPIGKILFITITVVAIASLHYLTQYSRMYHHIVYRELYFLPLIFGGLWFGLRGGVITSIGVIICYLPFVVFSWDNFSPNDLGKSLEIFLFIVVAVLVGTMHDRETARNREKIESIKAMAGTIAHELNTPLQVILGNAQLLQEDFNVNSNAYMELQGIIRNIREMDKIIKKISLVDRVELTDYTDDTKILNIEIPEGKHPPFDNLTSE